jgi:hypothetical protein
MLQLAFLLDGRGEVDEAMHVAQAAGAQHVPTARALLAELLRHTGRAREAETLQLPTRAASPSGDEDSDERGGSQLRPG